MDSTSCPLSINFCGALLQSGDGLLGPVILRLISANSVKLIQVSSFL